MQSGTLTPLKDVMFWMGDYLIFLVLVALTESLNSTESLTDTETGVPELLTVKNNQRLEQKQSSESDPTATASKLNDTREQRHGIALNVSQNKATIDNIIMNDTRVREHTLAFNVSQNEATIGPIIMNDARVHDHGIAFNLTQNKVAIENIITNDTRVRDHELAFNVSHNESTTGPIKINDARVHENGMHLNVSQNEAKMKDTSVHGHELASNAPQNVSTTEHIIMNDTNVHEHEQALNVPHNEATIEPIILNDTRVYEHGLALNVSQNEATIDNDTADGITKADFNKSKFVSGGIHVTVNNMTAVEDDHRRLHKIIRYRHQRIKGTGYPISNATVRQRLTSVSGEHNNTNGTEIYDAHLQNVSVEYDNVTDTVDKTDDKSDQNITDSGYNDTEVIIKTRKTPKKAVVDIDTNNLDNKTAHYMGQNLASVNDTKEAFVNTDELLQHNVTGETSDGLNDYETETKLRENEIKTDDSSTEYTPYRDATLQQHLEETSSRTTEPILVPKSIPWITINQTVEEDDIVEMVPEAVQIWLHNIAEIDEEDDDWSWTGSTIWDDYRVIGEFYEYGLEQDSSVLAAILAGNSDRSIL